MAIKRIFYWYFLLQAVEIYVISWRKNEDIVYDGTRTTDMQKTYELYRYLLESRHTYINPLINAISVPYLTYFKRSLSVACKLNGGHCFG